MTYEERKQQVCKVCHNRIGCAYPSRDLEDKCTYLQNVMEGWELGQEDTLKSLWKDAQGNDLPAIDREVVVFTQNFPDDAGIMRIAIAHRPNPNGWDGKLLSTGKVEHFEPKTYDKGGWSIPDVKYWLDAPLPEGIE